MTLDQEFLEAVRRHKEGRGAEAESLYRKVLSYQPGHADAMHLLGILAHETGRNVEALDLLHRAIASAPERAHFYRSLGVVLADQHQFAGAIEQYCKALDLRPGYPEALYNLGNARLESRQLEQAIEAYRRALEIRPDFPEAENNLGVALEESERLDESIEVFRSLLSRRPDFAGAQNNYGNALRDLGLLDEALAAYRVAMLQGPDPRPASRFLLTIWYHPNYDRRQIYEEHVRWEQTYARPLSGSPAPYSSDPSPHRDATASPESRLRIGYVSPDFRHHSCSFYLFPLLSHHDRENFEIFCYSDVRAADAMTERLRPHADLWRDIAGLSDEQVAQLVRRDQIDILVDLTMHMAYNRLLMFARKPAPVQATWLGYPGTTGLKTIDYRISDPYIDPPGVNDNYYSEKTIRLPDCYWCYDPLDPGGTSEVLESKTEIVFGCLNNFSKVNDVTLDLWAKVLERVASSRLILRAPKGSARQRIVMKLRQRGIDPDRIEFVERQSRADYLATHHRIDLCLDTFPYNGHTTILDALWMGVPTVTLAGQTAVSRGGLSILSNAGLVELVATSPEDYVLRASELASDRPRLAQLRATLRDRMRVSPLMDAPRFARNMEAAFRQMWQSGCASA